MDDFTIRKQEMKALFNQEKYQEVIEKCTKYIAELDKDDFAVHNQISLYYKTLYDCYFRLSDKIHCEEVLMNWIIYAVDDDEIYKIHFARVILNIVTESITNKTMDLLEQCIGRYKSLDRTKQVADLLVWKGIATQDAKYCKEALKLYEECEEDTSVEEAFVFKTIKELRHLH